MTEINEVCLPFYATALQNITYDISVLDIPAINSNVIEEFYAQCPPRINIVESNLGPPGRHIGE